MVDLLIQNADVLDVPAEGAVQVLRDHEVATVGNRIDAVEPAGTISPGQADEVLDAGGMLVMPGLINTHAHVPMVLFRGAAEDVPIEQWFNDYIWPLESNLQAEDVYWGMLLGLAEMIEAGVTTVADHYFYMDDVARAVDKAGTRAVLGWAVFGDQGKKILDRTAQFVEEWQGAAGGRISTLLAPHAPYTCDDDFLRAAVTHAKRLDVGIHTHVAETHQQTQSSLEKRGLTPVQVLDRTGVLDRPTILAHVVGAMPEDIELLAERPAGIAHAPKTYAKLAMDAAPVVEFREAGIPVGLATDGVVSNNTLDIWESMRLMPLMQKHTHLDAEVMPIGEVLRIATRGSAEVLGLEDEVGAVVSGRKADLILVDTGGMHMQPAHNLAANLVYSARAGDVQTVIVDGEIIMRDRQLLTLDKDEIIAQITKRLKRLTRRVTSERIQNYNP